MSVLCTWMYNGTGGSLLVVVLLHAATNLPLTLLIAPLGDEMTMPFLVLVALMVLTAATVAGVTGAADLSRSRARQVSVP
jgi:membrane protease YdiL (CAAX protease family)